MLSRPSLAPGIVWLAVALAGTVAVLSGVGAPGPASAGGFVVNTTVDAVDADLQDELCDSDLETTGLQCTLRAAVQQANENDGTDSIQLPEGTYTLDIVGSDDDAEKGDLDVTDDAFIISGSIVSGAGSAGTVIQAGETPGSGIDRVFDIDSGVSVEIAGLTVRHGTIPAGRGGGILNQGVLTLDRVNVASNSAMDGGGVFNESGSVLLTDSTLEDNSAAIDGGAMYNESGSASLDSVDVTGNEAGANGAGINSEGNGASLLVQDSTISSNIADEFNGGGIDAEGANGTLNVVSSLITNNSTGMDGGGIYISGTTDATVSGSVIGDNTTGSNGGGIYAFLNSELTLSGSSISGNDAGFFGGGVYHGGSSAASISDSTIDGNTAATSGGGVYSWKTSTLVNVTVSGNSAGGDGGGIFIRSATTITSSTITANGADSNSDGSGDGGGLFVSEEGTALLGRSIVAGNSDPTSDPDCFGEISSQGYNLIQTVSAGCDIAGNETGNITNEDPLLGPLANNGGPTRTHALLPDSPAIDAVTTTCPPPPADQRGVARPQGPACDMGAYEREPGRQVIWGDHNCSGAADPVDALLNLRHDAGLPAETNDCPEMGEDVDVEGSGTYGWGDLDCSAAADPVDGLKILRFDAGLDVARPVECPDPGETVMISDT